MQAVSANTQRGSKRQPLTAGRTVAARTSIAEQPVQACSIFGIDAQQPQRVGCCGSSKIVGTGRTLDHAAGIHHRDRVGHLGDDAEVVRDQHDRHAGLAAEARASSSRICAWIVTSSAVVGSSAISSLGSHDERHRDHHPLAHAAGHLVRILVEAALRVGNADIVPAADRRSRRLRAAARSCSAHRFDDLVADRCRPGSGWSSAPGRSSRCRCRGFAHLRRRQAGEVSPSNMIRPASMRPGGGTRRMIDIAVTDLPQPDSPTMPRVRPAATEMYPVHRRHFTIVSAEHGAHSLDAKQRGSGGLGPLTSSGRGTAGAAVILSTVRWSQSSLGTSASVRFWASLKPAAAPGSRWSGHLPFSTTRRPR